MTDFFASKKFIKVWLAALAGIFAILALVYFSSPTALRPKLDTSGVLVKKTTEEDRLRDINARLLDEAAKHPLQPVPPITNDDWVTGSRMAPATLIVYYDFDDSFSARFHEVVKEAIGKYGDKLDVVWRVYPLSGHAQARPAGLAFMCAAEQGKAYDYADRLFALKRAGELSKENYSRVAGEEKLDLARFKDCFDSHKYDERLSAVRRQAEAAGVIGVPHSFLNGRSLPGSWQFVDFFEPSGQPQDGLGTLIDKIIKNK